MTMETIQIVATNGEVTTFRPTTNLWCAEMDTPVYLQEKAKVEELWQSVVAVKNGTNAELLNQLTIVKRQTDGLTIKELDANLWLVCDLLEDLLLSDVNAHEINKTTHDVMPVQYIIQTNVPFKNSQKTIYMTPENQNGKHLFNTSFGLAETFNTPALAHTTMTAVAQETNNQYALTVVKKPMPTW